VEDQVTARAIAVLVVLVLAFAGGAGLYCAGKSDGERSVRLKTIEAKKDTVRERIREAEDSTRVLEPIAREAVKRTQARRAERRKKPVKVIDSVTVQLGEELLTAEPRVISIIAEDQAIQSQDSITIDVLQALNRSIAAERDAWKAEALLSRDEIRELKNGQRMKVLKVIGTTVVVTITLVGGILAAVVAF
jgi:hypothetical protein